MSSASSSNKRKIPLQTMNLQLYLLVCVCVSHEIEWGHSTEKKRRSRKPFFILHTIKCCDPLLAFGFFFTNSQRWHRHRVLLARCFLHCGRYLRLWSSGNRRELFRRTHRHQKKTCRLLFFERFKPQEAAACGFSLAPAVFAVNNQKKKVGGKDLIDRVGDVGCRFLFYFFFFFLKAESLFVDGLYSPPFLVVILRVYFRHLPWCLVAGRASSNPGDGFQLIFFTFPSAF